MDMEEGEKDQSSLEKVKEGRENSVALRYGEVGATRRKGGSRGVLCE